MAVRHEPGEHAAIWREMFNVIPDGGFGLNLDPSHLVWQMIDYERVVYDFADRILTCTPRTWRSTATASTSTACCRRA